MDTLQQFDIGRRMKPSREKKFIYATAFGEA